MKGALMTKLALQALLAFWVLGSSQNLMAEENSAPEPAPPAAEPAPSPTPEPTPAPSPAETPAPTEPAVPTSVAVFPSEVLLHNHRDRQSLVVQATYANGITRDVTAEAQFTFAQPELVDFRDFTIWPKTDGQTTLTIQFSNQTLSVPIAIAGAASDPPVSFHLDVMPVFMRTDAIPARATGRREERMDSGFRCSVSTPRVITIA